MCFIHAGVEAEATGHGSARLPVRAERAARAGPREERAEHETAAGPAAAAAARGEPAEETTGKRDAEGKTQSKGELTHCWVFISAGENWCKCASCFFPNSGRIISSVYFLNGSLIASGSFSQNH